MARLGSSILTLVQDTFLKNAEQYRTLNTTYVVLTLEWQDMVLSNSINAHQERKEVKLIKTFTR